jgi:hypothetical protein
MENQEKLRLRLRKIRIIIIIIIIIKILPLLFFASTKGFDGSYH